MSRSCFLPCWTQNNTYPEIGMWMRFYERWQNEIDELRVSFDLPHGESLTKMVNETKAEYLLFCEMDGIIFKKGVVDYYFKLLESDQYDIIGSPRMSCTPLVAEIAQKRFNLNYEGEGDKGPHFWPNFFFVKKSTLLKTDLNFMNKAWFPGEVLEGQQVTEECSSDTMGWMSLQLREIVPANRILEVPQYHTAPWDMVDYQNKRGIFDGVAPWIHIGSISSPVFEPHTDMEQKELCKRLLWQSLCGKDVALWENMYLSQENRDLFTEWKQAYKELLGL